VWQLSFLTILLTSTLSAMASSTTMSFNYKDADLSKVIEDYSKASGQKFIVDANLKGKITIMNPTEITTTEAFNQLSSALAVNGCGISDQEGVMVVEHARTVQRDLIETGEELPPLRPEKMFTWVINLKNATADDVNKELRILTSRDGELVALQRTNQLIVTDWVSNLYRVAKIIKAVDISMPTGKTVADKTKVKKDSHKN
jgi:general secretion pathway protein D